MGGKKYRLEDDLLKKSIPKRGSARYERLMRALWASDSIDRKAWNYCERCKRFLFNPQSILLHQGGFCRKKISEKKP